MPKVRSAKPPTSCLALPQAREACPHNLAPTTSSLMQLALGDALAIALLESRGFTAVDFGVFHPRGKLGAALKFIRDVMHPGAARALDRARRVDVGGDRRNVGQGIRLRGRHRRRRQARRRHHRRRFAPSHARRLAAGAGRRDHDGFAEDRPARSTGRARRCNCSMRRRSPRSSSWTSERPVGIVHFHDLLRRRRVNGFVIADDA